MNVYILLFYHMSGRRLIIGPRRRSRLIHWSDDFKWFQIVSKNSYQSVSGYQYRL